MIIRILLLSVLLAASPTYAGLKDDAAVHGWIYGCAATSADLQDPTLRTAIAQNCSLLSSTVGGKMHEVTPQPGIWDFSDLDRVADFARTQGQALHIHTLVWGRDDKNPAWLLRLSSSQRQDFMREYIRAVLSRYPEARYVDVVNEPVSFSANLWEYAMGEQYLDIAFAEARQTTNATLVLNEYGLEWDISKQQAMLALLQRLKNRGVPVQALGLESHLSAMPAPKPFRQLVHQVRKLGIEVLVTELDVRNTADDNFVANVYCRYLWLLRKVKIGVVQTWGLRDPSSSYRPLPLDSNSQVKLAYGAIASTLQNASFMAPSEKKRGECQYGEYQ